MKTLAVTPLFLRKRARSAGRKPPIGHKLLFKTIFPFTSGGEAEVRGGARPVTGKLGAMLLREWEINTKGPTQRTVLSFKGHSLDHYTG